MSTITLTYPAALLPSINIIGTNNQPLTVAPTNGTYVADTRLLPQLLQLGFTFAPAVGATSARPTVATYPGQKYFDTTLGYPVWRNAANSGWINASGTSV